MPASARFPAAAVAAAATACHERLVSLEENSRRMGARVNDARSEAIQYASDMATFAEAVATHGDGTLSLTSDDWQLIARHYRRPTEAPES